MSLDLAEFAIPHLYASHEAIRIQGTTHLQDILGLDMRRRRHGGRLKAISVGHDTVGGSERESHDDGRAANKSEAGKVAEIEKRLPRDCR
jgi:hypothetical protein